MQSVLHAGVRDRPPSQHHRAAQEETDRADEAAQPAYRLSTPSEQRQQDRYRLANRDVLVTSVLTSVHVRRLFSRRLVHQVSLCSTYQWNVEQEPRRETRRKHRR